MRILFGKLLHRHAVQRCRIHPNLRTVPDQVIQTVAFISGLNKCLGLLASVKFLHGERPLVVNGRSESLRTGTTCYCILLESLACTLIQLPSGFLQGLGYLVEFFGRRLR